MWGTDEVLKMPMVVFYNLNDKIRPHLVHPDAVNDLLSYIKMMYGKTPETVKRTNAIYLDPGGMVFADSKSPKKDFFVEGINYEVKPEKMLEVINILKQGGKELATNKNFTKFYLRYEIVVIPKTTVRKLLEELQSDETFEEALEARNEFMSGVSDLQESGHFYEPPPESEIEASLIKNLFKIANFLEKNDLNEEAESIVDMTYKILP